MPNPCIFKMSFIKVRKQQQQQKKAVINNTTLLYT